MSGVVVEVTCTLLYKVELRYNRVVIRHVDQFRARKVSLEVKDFFTEEWGEHVSDDILDEANAKLAVKLASNGLAKE